MATEEKQYHVLIVDDVPANLNFVSDVLFQEGLDITIATNGHDALDIANSKKPDLILLDISMPKMDGYEVCTRLKASNATIEIPVVFLTAKIDSEDIIKGFEVGAVDYIAKPFNAMELVSRVKTHLELKANREQLKKVNQLLEEKVSERTKELHDSHTELEEAYEKLSKLDKAKNEFILHINHELRTPLQGIHGYSKLLEEYTNNEEQAEFVRGLNRLTDRLVRLSEMTLLFTELRSDSYKEDVRPISVHEIMESLVDKYFTNEKNISFKTDVKPEGLLLEYDRKLISSCLDIFMDNAIKYTIANDIVILRAFEEKDYYVLEVEDHGPGFSEKAKSELFDVFTSDNLDHHSHGFGLGLATAKLITDNLGGNIKILQNHIGATIRITLPFK